MNSKLRNSLSALAVAASFLSLSYAASEPAPSQSLAAVEAPATDSGTVAVVTRAPRVGIGMPYFSFAKRTKGARS